MGRMRSPGAARSLVTGSAMCACAGAGGGDSVSSGDMVETFRDGRVLETCSRGGCLRVDVLNAAGL